jgi:hypothetical protein
VIVPGIGRARGQLCNGCASCGFAQQIIKTVNLHSIMQSIMIGFLTGSKSLPQENAYKSCALCISNEQSVLKTINHPRDGAAQIDD